MSKKSEDIFFINIENDGYSLNANRNKIRENDLPISISKIKEDKDLNKIKKNKIINSDDISFVYSKYLEEKIIRNSKYVRSKLSELVDIFSGSRQKGGSLSSGIPSIGGAQIGKNGNILNHKMVYVSEEHFNSMKKGKLQIGDVLIVKDGATTGKMGFYNGEFPKAAINEHIFALRVRKNYSNDLLYYLLRSDEFQKKLKPYIQGIIGGINLKFSNIEIPFPSLEIQKQIVKELDGYQKIIDGCREVIENYKTSIDIDPSWEMVELSDLCKKITDGSHFSPETLSDGMPYVTVKDLNNSKIDLLNCKKISKKDYDMLVKNGCKPNKDDTLFSKDGTVGKTAFVNEDNNFVILSSLAILTPDKSKIEPKFLFLLLSSQFFINEAINQKTGVAIKRIVLKTMKKIKVPLPPKNIQIEIIQALEKEMQLVENNENLLSIFNGKIEQKINSIWSK